MKIHFRFLFAFVITLVASVLAVHGADRVALVIGNNAYDPTGRFPVLKNCIGDARLIADTLEKMGFKVIRSTDATRSGMDAKLTEFEAAISPGGTAIFYFAGHGIEFKNKNYIMGTNARLEAQSRLGEEALDAETFAAAMLEHGAKASFVFLDCCREAPPTEWLTRGVRKSGLADVKVDGDIYIAYAAKPGQAAADGNGVNSPYATAVAKFLPQGLPHTEFFQKVREDVSVMTNKQQRTWENGSFIETFRFPAVAEFARLESMRPPVPVIPNRVDTGKELSSATKSVPFMNSLGMKFVPLPGTGVLMSIWETRVQDYEAFVRATKHEWNKPDFAQGPTHPAVNVSWEDAKVFCEWLSKKEGQEYRLPTDEEWSLAVGLKEKSGISPKAKDNGKGPYPWGSVFPPPKGAGNYSSRLNVDSFENTAPVGSFAANALGIYDLGGNAWEWCEDRYDPTAKNGDASRVLRGASWNFRDSVNLRSSFRNGDLPSDRDNDVGFRVVVAAR